MWRGRTLAWAVPWRGRYSGVGGTLAWAVPWRGRYSGVGGTLAWAVPWRGRYRGVGGLVYRIVIFQSGTALLGRDSPRGSGRRTTREGRPSRLHRPALQVNPTDHQAFTDNAANFQRIRLQTIYHTGCTLVFV